MSKASEHFFEMINKQHRAHDPETINELTKQHAAEGTHMWVAIASYHITEKTMEEIANKSGELRLGMDNLTSINFGCYMCEQPFAPGLMKVICQPVPGMGVTW